MNIQLAKSDADTGRCFPVMVQLRPHLTADDFIVRVKRQFQLSGYRLAYVEVNGKIKAVAGFRITEMLFRGRFMYVDDLVTESTERSKGYGAALFDWLLEYAKTQNCEQFALDSGVHRSGAHRFYFTKRMEIVAYHFSLNLND